MKKSILMLVIGLLIHSNSWALSPEAEAGKTLIGVCEACHAENLDPPKAPPLFALNRRYSKRHVDKEAFVDAIRNFVQKPQAEAALLPRAVEVMGLMPALPLEDDMLNKIAAYLYEEHFPYPCEHWRIGVKMNKEKGDLEHAAKDQRKLDRFCQ